MFPILLLGLGLGAAALAKRASEAPERPEVELLRPAVPYAGPLAFDLVAVLVARQRTIEGEAPPRPFKVRIVGLPSREVPLVTGLLLEPIAPMNAGTFLQFTPDKIASVTAGV